MRGDKDEEKVISPMFPRLHVNDTERGGPRAPPRNKMALYEQLSVPSQQSFSSRSASMAVPLPPGNGVSRLVPSPSSSAHGCGGRERSQFTPFCNSPAPCHSTEKTRSHSSIGANLGSTIACHESAKPIEHHKSLSATRPLQQPIPPNFPNFRNLSLRKHTGEDASPTLSRSGVVSHSIDTRQRKDQFPLFRPSSSIQGTEQNSRQQVRNVSGDSPKVCQEPTDRYISISSTKERTCGSLKRVRESSDQNHHRSLLEAVSKRRGLFQEAVASREKTKTTLVEETCSRPAAGGGDKECGSVRVGETEKDNEISDSSMVDSVSVLDISPDDVVGVIGEKHFLKARRAIVNQQRVFAVQVFELHRLIKVQRLIAESPHLLLEHALSLRKPSSKGSLAKKLQSESVLEPRNGSQNPNAENTECGAESALPKLPLPLPLVDESSKGLASHKPFYRPYTGSTQPPQPLAPDPKPSPWCFHPPPGNQWLVPVMSPSEGFVYKPYTGPGPPNAGLMAPVYGGYDPMNAGFGILPGTTPMGQPYFPPYGMNPSASGSAVEQVSPFAKGHEDQQSNVDINLAMSSQMSRAISCRVKKQASKESEVQGSTASSPSSRVNGEALTLFPLASDLNAGEPPARVIKVVPHNPRSATESAARILQFIQEERKQFD